MKAYIKRKCYWGMFILQRRWFRIWMLNMNRSYFLKWIKIVNWLRIKQCWNDNLSENVCRWWNKISENMNEYHHISENKFHPWIILSQWFILDTISIAITYLSYLSWRNALFKYFTYFARKFDVSSMIENELAIMSITKY
jgi:hypothetical protein